MKFTQEEIKFYLAIIVPILLILIFLLYRNTFYHRSKNVDIIKDYQKDVKSKNLETCYQLDNDFQYKLCDYYIASSYQTPCLGNLHYDYVGIEPIIEVLKAGVRFIEIPICQEDIKIDSLPVIATAEDGTEKVITSLNTLNFEKTISKIKEYIFKEKMKHT